MVGTVGEQFQNFNSHTREGVTLVEVIIEDAATISTHTPVRV